MDAAFQVADKILFNPFISRRNILLFVSVKNIQWICKTIGKCHIEVSIKGCLQCAAVIIILAIDSNIAEVVKDGSVLRRVRKVQHALRSRLVLRTDLMILTKVEYDVVRAFWCEEAVWATIVCVVEAEETVFRKKGCLRLFMCPSFEGIPVCDMVSSLDYVIRAAEAFEPLKQTLSTSLILDAGRMFIFIE